jgi:hypothetical protein
MAESTRSARAPREMPGKIFQVRLRWDGAAVARASARHGGRAAAAHSGNERAGGARRNLVRPVEAATERATEQTAERATEAGEPEQLGRARCRMISAVLCLGEGGEED